MRIAAERHDIPGRQRPVHDVALRQISEAPRALAQGKRRQRIAADMNGAGGGTSPAKARNSVVLPAPFGPTSATKRPDGSESETSFSTPRPAKTTLMPRALKKADAVMRRLRRARAVRA